jgi:hypothetical protein
MGILLDQGNIERGPVGDDFSVVAIEDMAPWWRQLSYPDPVAVGLVFIFLAMADLKKPESQDNDDQEKNDDG